MARKYGYGYGVNRQVSRKEVRSSNVMTLLGNDALGYWTADRADKITLSGSDMTAWSDMVAGYQFVPSSSRPTYSFDSVSGRGQAVADGVDDYFTCTDAAFLTGLPIGSTPGEIWFIGSQDADSTETPANDRTAASYGGTALNEVRRIARRIASTVNRARISVGTGAAVSTRENTSVELSGIVIMRGIFQASQAIMEVNGIASTALSAVPATLATRFRILSLSGTTPQAFWKGTAIAVLATKPLSSDKAAALYSLMNARKNNTGLLT